MVCSLGSLVLWSNRSSRRHNYVGVSPLVLSREVLSTCLALSSPANKFSNPRRKKRPCPLQSVGGKAKGKPQGISPVCRRTWLERAVSGGHYHGGPKLLCRPSCQSVRWQTLLECRKAWQGLRNVSHRIQTSIPCWLRIMLQLKLPARTPFAFQQARRRALHRSLLLGCAAIIGHKQNMDL